MSRRGLAPRATAVGNALGNALRRLSLPLPHVPAAPAPIPMASPAVPRAQRMNLRSLPPPEQSTRPFLCGLQATLATRRRISLALWFAFGLHPWLIMAALYQEVFIMQSVLPSGLRTGAIVNIAGHSGVFIAAALLLAQIAAQTRCGTHAGGPCAAVAKTRCARRAKRRLSGSRGAGNPAEARRATQRERQWARRCAPVLAVAPIALLMLLAVFAGTFAAIFWRIATPDGVALCLAIAALLGGTVGSGWTLFALPWITASAEPQAVSAAGLGNCVAMAGAALLAAVQGAERVNAAGTTGKVEERVVFRCVLREGR